VSVQATHVVVCLFLQDHSQLSKPQNTHCIIVGEVSQYEEQKSAEEHVEHIRTHTHTRTQGVSTSPWVSGR
jgi:hypothetical protein